MNLGGLNFTNFQNLRLKGSGDGSTGGPATAGALRVVATSALESTLSVNTTYQDSNYQWTLPAKSGPIGVSGTFTVNVPAVSAGALAQTTVVVAGLRAEDGFSASVMNNAYETSVTTNRGYLVLLSARPTNTGVEMVFANPSGTATGVLSPIISYTAVR